MNAAEEREADWVAQTKDLQAELDAARAKLDAGLNAVDFWLDEGFKRDMAGDAEGRDGAIDIVTQEIRKSLGGDAS